MIDSPSSSSVWQVGSFIIQPLKLCAVHFPQSIVRIVFVCYCALFTDAIASANVCAIDILAVGIDSIGARPGQKTSLDVD